MNSLQTALRTAQTKRLTRVPKDLVGALSSLKNDVGQVVSFWVHLNHFDRKEGLRTLVACKQALPNLFKKLRKAADEYTDEQLLPEDEAEMMEDELGEDEAEMMEDELGEDEGFEAAPGDEDLESMEEADDLADPEEDESLEEPEEDVESMEDDLPDDVESMEDDLPPEDEDAPPAEMMEDEGIEEEEDIGEEAVEPVVDPDELESMGEEEEDLSLAMVYFNKPEAKWAVFANGRPLAEVRLADQENPDEITDIFASEAYSKHVQEGARSSLGVRETLNSINARWYVAKTNKSALMEKAREAAAAEMEGTLVERIATLKGDLLNAVYLAIAASNKGLFVANPLKKQLTAAMAEAGVAQPVHVLNGVWDQAAQEYMDTVLTAAEKWMGYTPETYREMQAQILEGTVEHDVAEVQAEMRAQTRQGMVSVPIRTVTTPPHAPSTDDDFRSSVSQGLRTRFLQRNK